MEQRIKEYTEKYGMSSFLNREMLEELELIMLGRHKSLLTEETMLDYLYFLVEGQLSCIHHNYNGNIDVIALTEPLAVIGDVELLDEEPSSTAVTAVYDSVLLGLRMEKVRKYGFDDPCFLQFIIRQLAGKIRKSTVLRYGSVLSVRTRLALYILSHYGEAVNGIIILPEKEMLASMLGTSGRHLNRVLKELVDKGAVGKGYPGMRIKDLGCIRRLAEDSMN